MPLDRQPVQMGIGDRQPYEPRQPGRRRSRPSAAENSELLKGRTRLPSLLVPSANRTMLSPLASRSAISPALCFTRVRRVRSMKTVRCSLASRLKKGHLPTSDFATKETGATALKADDVEPGDMIGNEQSRFAGIDAARDMDADAEHPADELMIEVRQRPGLRQIEPEQHVLDQHQRQRYRKKNAQEERRPASQRARASPGREKLKHPSPALISRRSPISSLSPAYFLVNGRSAPLCFQSHNKGGFRRGPSGQVIVWAARKYTESELLVKLRGLPRFPPPLRGRCERRAFCSHPAMQAAIIADAMPRRRASFATAMDKISASSAANCRTARPSMAAPSSAFNTIRVGLLQETAKSAAGQPGGSACAWRAASAGASGGSACIIRNRMGERTPPHPSPLPPGGEGAGRGLCNSVPSPLAGEGQDEGVSHVCCGWMVINRLCGG